MPARPSTGGHTDTEQEKFMNIDWLNFTPWASLAGGLLIGLAASLFVVANGRIAGVSGLIGSLLQRGAEGLGEKALFLLGLLVAPLLWGLFTHLPAIEFQSGAVGLIIAGLLVGIGTRYGSGCTSGHGVCGLSRLSPRSMVATACFMFSGFATVFVLRHWLGI
ncbi:YeeE/YedE family protein [Pseudomonas thivervalensis]|uniref:YeeE/YedE family protein n=1 Tax=Pseudomonas thivervalensis TaxID=86265 RepID=UPI003F502978